MVHYFFKNLAIFIKAGIIFLFTIIIAKVASLTIDKNVKIITQKTKEKLSTSEITRLKLIQKLIIAAIYFIGTALALYQFPEVAKIGATMFASVAIVGLVFGIAAQPILGNMLAGIMIAFTRSIRLGDFIQVNGQIGEVEEITLIHTRIKTKENKRLIIPNKILAENKIFNFSVVDLNHPVEIFISIDRKIDLGKFKKDLKELLFKEGLIKSKKTIFINIENLSQETVTLKLLTLAKDYKEAKNLESNLKEKIFKEFKEKIIELRSEK